MFDTPTDSSAPTVTLDGRTYDYFCGCGYHELQDSPVVRAAAADVLERYPFKQGPSRYGYSENAMAKELIAECATFFNTESAITYPSGYMGNSILLKALSDDFDVILYDEAAHLSMMDAIVLSQKPAIPFKHLDPADFEAKLASVTPDSSRPLLACNGVSPVTGRIAPLPDYVTILEKRGDFLVVVDDSHGTGVMGAHGRGILEHYGLSGPQFHFTATLSKGIGSHGGVIPCARDFKKERLIGVPMVIGSTELPLPTVAAAIASLRFLREHPDLITALHENALYFKHRLLEIGYSVGEEPSGIAAITMSDPEKLRALHAHLREKGIISLYMAPGSYSGTPPAGAVKFSIFSNHTREQFDRVIDALSE